MSSSPPPARRGGVVETLHGVEVADPYRWMEDLDDPELAAWVDAQAAAAAQVLAGLPGRDAVSATLARVWDHPRRGAPRRRGRRWFQQRNDGLADHDRVWVADADASLPDDPAWRVLLDPNAWDEQAASLASWVPSPDGAKVAYAVARAGSDWLTWHVHDVATGDELDEVVEWSKFADVAWLGDGSGFVHTAYDPPPPGEVHEAAVRDQRLELRRLGAGRSEPVHARPDRPEWSFTPLVTHDGRWLVLTVTRGTDPESRIHVAPLHDRGGQVEVGEVRPLVDDDDGWWEPLGVVAGEATPELWCRTTADAPTGRVVAVVLHDGALRVGTAQEVVAPREVLAPQEVLAPREVLAAREEVLQHARLVGGEDGTPLRLLTVHLHHAASRLGLLDPDGDWEQLELPDLGTAGGRHDSEGLSGGRADDRAFVTFETFSAPARLLEVDTRAAVVRTAWTPPPTGTHDDVVTERVLVHGDVDVPVFLVHRADVVPTGEVPTVLWGYGGFGIAVTPHHRPGWSAWVAHGGLLAVACLRGGAEYGRGWHDDGRLGAKQHVFDDALAVAGWCCGEGTASDVDGAEVRTAAWTSPAHLGIEGRSNGGLLVGALLTQAPHRFGSAVPEVGVLDLLRFHRFTIGWAWTSDYGDPDDPAAFGWVRAYSPLHRVEPGVAYPPTLLTTGDTDDRVVPSHSFKFAAALQHAQAGDGPILLRVDRAAGHGAGKPTSQLLDERADVLAWHAHHLGLDLEQEDAP